MKNLLQSLNPFTIKITRAGLIYTILTIFLGISAVNTGNNLLYVIVSLLLSFMWLSGVFSKQNLSGLEVEVLHNEDLFSEVEGKITVRLKKRWSLFPVFLLRIKVFVKAPDGKKATIYGKLSFFRNFTEKSLSYKPSRRGRHQVERVELSSIFPMGLFERKREFKLSCDFVVYPQPIRCEEIFQTNRREIYHDQMGNRQRGSSEFERLENYVPGVPIRLISWKSLAKWDDPKQKVFVEGEAELKHIIVEDLPGEDLEAKLSCATYIVLKAYEKRKKLLVSLGGKTFALKGEREAMRRILQELALYEEPNRVNASST